LLALRWHARGDVRLDEVREPESRPGFALVAVDYCGICGSDVAELAAGPVLIRPEPHPLTGQAPPLTLGHEVSGRVVEGRLPEGSRVTVDACWRCGRCEACADGDYHLCRYGGSVGLHSDGGFARLVRVPEYTLVPLADSVSGEQGALTEPFAVALHGLKRAALGAGESVLVLGFGPIGAAGALLARALGGVPLIVEKSEPRAALAERLGFRTLEAGEELARRVRAALGSGGAHVVLEATGVASLMPVAIECARRAGRIVLLGIGHEAVPVDPRRLTLFERSLLGSLGYRNDLPTVVAMVGAGLVDPAAIVTDVIPLARAPEALARLATDPGGEVKVLVQPEG
jgi:(R,R)-butanediol dehydrogenase / meso-butanediol dehydrogenase / diacetyl reductase